jgi:glyoxylase-like metal-dependent hydrolase (beta-lactamase superfamily II)
VRVNPNIAVVASGSLGFDLTHPLDCHAYLIGGDDALVVIDTGVGIDVDALLTQVRMAGADPAEIAAVLLTHVHGDHAGGAAALQRATGAMVYASSHTIAVLRSGDEAASGLEAARRAGYYPDGYAIAAPEGMRELCPGAPLRFGTLEIDSIDTPGHCDGHVSYLVHARDRTDLFVGDAVFWGGSVLLQEVPDVSIPRTADSCRRLAELTFDGLFPGHGVVSLSRGRDHVLRAVRTFDSLGMPGDVRP